MTKEAFEFDFEIVVKYLKIYRWRIILFAFVSLALTLAVGIAAFLLLPSTNLYSQEIQILLPRKSQNTFTSEVYYPSERIFNRLDLVSPPVLKKVYESHNLKDYISFEDFQNNISVLNFSLERAIVEADYTSKLARRNLSATDITILERNFKNALNAIESDRFRIVLQQDLIPPTLAQMVLIDIPASWYEIYREMESDRVSLTNINAEMAARFTAESAGSSLIALDHFRYYLDELMQVVDNLNLLINDRNISLPTGEYFGDVQARLKYIESYHLEFLKQLVLESSALRSQLDTIYAQSRLDGMKREAQIISNQEANLKESIDLTHRKISSGGGSVDASNTFTVDGSVLEKLQELYVRDANMNLRREIVNEYIQLGKQSARLQTNVSYYEKMLEALQLEPIDVTSSRQHFETVYAKMLAETVELSKMVMEFKNMLTRDYYDSRNFYIPAGETTLVKDRLIPPEKLALFLIGFWVLLNAAYIGILATQSYLDAARQNELAAS